MLQVTGQLLDWSQPCISDDYDVALACDVLYEAASVEPVAKVIPKLLNPQTGTLLLSDPLLRTKENRYSLSYATRSIGGAVDSITLAAQKGLFCALRMLICAVTGCA